MLRGSAYRTTDAINMTSLTPIASIHNRHYQSNYISPTFSIVVPPIHNFGIEILRSWHVQKYPTCQTRSYSRYFFTYLQLRSPASSKYVVGSIYGQRHMVERITDRTIDSILASQTGRIEKFQAVVELGYDAKDCLLRHLRCNDDAEDVLARRYGAQRPTKSPKADL